MSMPLIRESACDCIHDIINKGMEPVAKTKLIESFTSILQNRGIFNPQEVRVHSLQVCVYSVKNRLTLCDRALIMECWCVLIIFRRRKEITWLNCPNLSMGSGSIWSSAGKSKNNYEVKSKFLDSVLTIYVSCIHYVVYMFLISIYCKTSSLF